MPNFRITGNYQIFVNNVELPLNSILQENLIETQECELGTPEMVWGLPPRDSVVNPLYVYRVINPPNIMMLVLNHPYEDTDEELRLYYVDGEQRHDFPIRRSEYEIV